MQREGNLQEAEKIPMRSGRMGKFLVTLRNLSNKEKAQQGLCPGRRPVLNIREEGKLIPLPHNPASHPTNCCHNCCNVLANKKKQSAKFPCTFSFALLLFSYIVIITTHLG